MVIAPAPSLATDDLRDAVTRVRKRGVKVRWAVVDPILGLEAPPEGDVVGKAIEVELALAARGAIDGLHAIGVRIVEARSLTKRHPAHRYDDIKEDRAEGASTMAATR